MSEDPLENKQTNQDIALHHLYSGVNISTGHHKTYTWRFEISVLT